MAHHADAGLCTAHHDCHHGCLRPRPCCMYILAQHDLLAATPQATPSAACASGATCRTTWWGRLTTSHTLPTTRTWTWPHPSAAAGSWRCGAWRLCTAWTGPSARTCSSSTSQTPGAAAHHVHGFRWGIPAFPSDACTNGSDICTTGAPVTAGIAPGYVLVVSRHMC